MRQFAILSLQVRVDRPRGPLARAHCLDDRRGAGDNVTAGKDTAYRCHSLIVNDDIALLVQLQVFQRRGKERIRPLPDRADDRIELHREL